jgi:cell division protein FtsB
MDNKFAIFSSTKVIMLVLGVLLAVLQYQLWFGAGGVTSIRVLNQSIATQTVSNDRLAERNRAVTADINDLQHGQQATEERARSQLGMIKQGEVYYQITN